ncbi:response regulator transcription factor [Gilvibacter sp.]|uniref:response regulator transcription factor n=1 Tax=Gilvibacter sp. TaxID=2729997 RepID=UPI0025C3DDB5|nr:response regulator transcription factor [Gilvibacter sp.]NQX77142.1 response regulator transcription factor [Gilvibacter sp.]
MTAKTKHNIVIVDDHLLFAGSLEKLLESFGEFNVLFHAKNGSDFQQKLKLAKMQPDVVLLDINMPVMDGFETANWLSSYRKDIKVLALSMDDDEETILRMLRCGANGYLLKDIHPDKLREALLEVIHKGYYHSEKVAAALLQSLNPAKEKPEHRLKENERIFISLACTEMTYKEIAEKMNLSPKTIDGYRHELFSRLQIKNRVGLVIYALKHDLYRIQ